ncbi:MAG: glucose-6-phosphate isomerase, archaeal [Pseudonocardiales bacterium]|jgi:glucose-6-phosphate isomerase|nr:glucose-6-phosphate isomerase, archaeal [Pseudonocardiales bacterium]
MKGLLARPTALRVEATGALVGHSSVYVKTWEQVSAIYSHADAARSHAVGPAGGKQLSYRVEEHQYVPSSAGALVFGTSTLLPGRVGPEFAMTRGHLHARPDRAETYHCLSGVGVLVMETVRGEREAIELTAGTVVHVPGDWIHRSVNVGGEPFVTAFCYSADAGQDYGIIEQAGGMATLIQDDGHGGWVAVDNPDHRGYRGVGHR